MRVEDDVELVELVVLRLDVVDVGVVEVGGIVEVVDEVGAGAETET
jgi:hypothetical protein